MSKSVLITMKTLFFEFLLRSIFFVDTYSLVKSGVFGPKIRSEKMFTVYGVEISIIEVLYHSKFVHGNK